MPSEHDPGPTTIQFSSPTTFRMPSEHDPGPTTIQFISSTTLLMRSEHDSGPLNHQFHVSDLVLLRHRTKASYSRSRAHKLDDRWSGPYRIRKIPNDSAYYLLEELDDAQLATTIAGNRLKRFFSRVDLDNNRFKAHDTIRVRDALEDDDEELMEDLRTGDVVDEED